MNVWSWIRNIVFGSALMFILIFQVFTYRMAYYTADKMQEQEMGLGIVSFAATQALSENKDILDLVTKVVQALPDAMDQRIALQKSKADKAVVTARMNLKESTVMIENLTVGAQGSGVMIKVNGEVRVLTAGHMIEDIGDEFVITEKGRQLDHLILVNVNKKSDLLLLKFADPEHIVSTVRPLEVAETAPVASSPVNLVGSPIGIEDLYSEGRVVGFSSNYMYFFDHVYFGSSGGGVYNTDGQLIGIISHMLPVQVQGVQFVIHACTNLTRIHEFLVDSVTPKTNIQLIKQLLEEMTDK